MRKRLTQRSSDGVAKLDRSSDPAPTSDVERSESRPRVPDAVPTAWLDRLLAAAMDLPYASGERAVLDALVDAVAGILPAYGVGATWIPEVASGRDRVVVRRVPEGVSDRVSRTDAVQVLPGFVHEYQVALSGTLAGSSLYVASDVDSLDPARSPAVHLIDRAAVVLGRALIHARKAASTGVQRSARQFEKGLIQTEKLATFGQLAAGVVHELNNPLTSIVAYSEYLIRKAENGGVRETADIDRLRRICESANRMLRFTRDLVSYTRPSSGVADEVPLHDVIDRAIAFCEHVLAAAHVRVERRYAVEPFRVSGITEQLVQVFVNLLTNACQAAQHPGGRVVITTERERGDVSDRVVIAIADDGAGISPEHLPHVFVPFFTTKRDRNGTGLGLSIVKSIVESHDGEVRVQSRLGAGAEFVIDLPVI
jgi:signal transduction histidine kinase